MMSLDRMIDMEQLRDWVNSVRPIGDNQTTKVTPTPDGTLIEAIDAGGGGGGGGGEEASGIDAYFFKVTAKDADEVTISAGKVIAGTTVISVDETDHTIDTSDDTYYVYIQIWYNEDWKTSYASDWVYPDQEDIDDGGTDFRCLRVVLAEVVVSDNVVQTPTQIWPGHEIHHTGIAD